MNAFRNIIVVLFMGLVSTPIVAAAACVPNWIGDGWCDPVNNNAACDFDGGDCGPRTEFCFPNTLPGCAVAGQASIKSSDKITGREQLELSWRKIADVTTQGSFGNPVSGTTHVKICIYGDNDVLLRGFIVDRAGDLCGGEPCWSATGMKGYEYGDEQGAVGGLNTIEFTSGPAGRGEANAEARNDARSGLVNLRPALPAALSGDFHPTIQLVTSDGFCTSATMDQVTKDNGLEYEARK